jgi:hypothetical protein
MFPWNGFQGEEGEIHIESDLESEVFCVLNVASACFLRTSA